MRKGKQATRSFIDLLKDNAIVRFFKRRIEGMDINGLNNDRNKDYEDYAAKLYIVKKRIRKGKRTYIKTYFKTRFVPYGHSDYW